MRLMRNELPADVPAEAGDAYSFVDFERRGALLLLAVGFAVLVVALGRARGVRALCGLAASAAVIFAFVVPAILGSI